MSEDDHSSLFWFMFAILVIGGVLLTTKVKAHNAPAGWPYPVECCGGSDCWEMPEGAVSETVAGFTIKASGEFVPRAQTKRSLDENYHLCRFPGPTIRCFFVPPRGF